jgi:hypothetical protein
MMPTTTTGGTVKSMKAESRDRAAAFSCNKSCFGQGALMTYSAPRDERCPDERLKI